DDPREPRDREQRGDGTGPRTARRSARDEEDRRPERPVAGDRVERGGGGRRVAQDRAEREQTSARGGGAREDDDDGALHRPRLTAIGGRHAGGRPSQPP